MDGPPIKDLCGGGERDGHAERISPCFIASFYSISIGRGDLPLTLPFSIRQSEWKRRHIVKRGPSVFFPAIGTFPVAKLAPSSALPRLPTELNLPQASLVWSM